ncbi:hypothetical protein C9J85_13990 [Haloferax sp. wsp5]|nr:hypothetical protein C9J85_13990 [Haloferax sp. wsp5]
MCVPVRRFPAVQSDSCRQPWFPVGTLVVFRVEARFHSLHWLCGFRPSYESVQFGPGRRPSS